MFELGVQFASAATSSQIYMYVMNQLHMYIHFTDTICDIYIIIKIRKLGAFICYLRQKSTFCRVHES